MDKQVISDRKLWILGVILLIVAVGVIVGVSLAYFSDVINEAPIVEDSYLFNSKKSIKRYYYKADGTDAIENIIFDKNGVLAVADAFNVGDIIEVTFNVKNDGISSLWVRDMYNLVIEKHNSEETVGENRFVLYKSNSPLSIDDIRNGVAINPINSGEEGIGVTYTTPLIFNGGSLNKDINQNDGGLNTIDAPLTIRYYLYFKEDENYQETDFSVTLNINMEAVKYRNNKNPLSIDWSSSQVLSTKVKLK